MSSIGKQSPRHESGLRFQRILVAVDGSEGSSRASEVAVDLAAKFDAQFFVLNVFRDYPEYMTVFPSAPAPSGEAIQAYQANARKAALEVVRRIAAMAEKKGVKAKPQTSETIGSIVQVITDYASGEKIDLIVMGTRGMGGFKRMLLGSVSSGVVTHAHCPVLVVR
ncbi:MAG TPA: universal stress protein [Candidatus Bathyarchaeia archaeon]|nr:universal stress protein [Candidatus Bathyarchaeia archaeon]